MAEGHAKDGWANNRAARWLAFISTGSAFVITMTALCGGLYLAYLGKELGGAAAVVAAIAVPVATFITRRHKNDSAK